MLERELVGHSGLSRRFELAEGNKVLELKIYPALGNDSTSSLAQIRNVNGRKKVSGATTALHQRVREIIQAEADRLDIPITYIATTENLSMQAWIEDCEKGKRVFEWDQVEQDDSWFTATKLIKPRRQNCP